MRTPSLPLMLLLLVSCRPAFAGPLDEALQLDLDAGFIDEDHAEVYRLLAFTRPDTLPLHLHDAALDEFERAQDEHGWACGTPYILPVLRHYDHYTPELQQLVVHALGTDDSDTTAPTASCNQSAPNEQESDHFVVKWGSSYSGSGVDDLLEALEAARATFVDDYGHQEPYGVGTGWKLPIFVGNSGSGMPTIGWSGGYTTTCTDHSGAYIVLSQDLTSWEFNADVGPHELYHAVQFGYGAWLDDWWWEATATWSEDLTYPDINGFVWFLSEYTSEPHVSIETANGAREYGMFIFPTYIEEFEIDGADALRKTWENPVSSVIPESLDAILQADHESTFDDAFAHFTARVATMEAFEDGSLFGAPVYVGSTDSYPFDSSDVDVQAPERYGTNFVGFHLDDSLDEPNTKLRFEFDGGGQNDWVIGLGKHRIADDLQRTQRVEVKGDGTAEVEVIDFGTLYDEIVLGISWNGANSNSVEYTWSVDVIEQTEPQGDDDDDDDVPIEDDDESAGSGCMAGTPYAYDVSGADSTSACSAGALRSGPAWAAMIGLLGVLAVRRRG